MSKKTSKLVTYQGADITALFSVALGLPGTAWRVSSSQLEADGHRIDIQTVGAFAQDLQAHGGKRTAIAPDCADLLSWRCRMR